MPTILVMLGWRLYFYANEQHEPTHLHCRKGDAEAKCWLDLEGFEAIEAHAYNLGAADKRTVRRIISEHFDYIVTERNRWQVRWRSGMDRAHDVQQVGFPGTILRLRVGGKEYQIDSAGVSTRLRSATPAEREHLEISPAGYGIHWPDIDEDLSIDGLIGVECAPPTAIARA